MFDIPTIETARLRLTALTERHFDDYAAMLADPDSTRWIGDGEPLDRTNAWRSLAMLLGHWQLRGFGMWALELKSTGEFIGRAGLMYPDGWPDLEMGWMLKPEHRHHGYATEAGNAVLDFAWTAGEFTATEVMASTSLTRSTAIDAVDTLVSARILRELPNARAVGAYRSGRPARC